jgi:hypothetical protein
LHVALKLEISSSMTFKQIYKKIQYEDQNSRFDADVESIEKLQINLPEERVRAEKSLHRVIQDENLTIPILLCCYNFLGVHFATFSWESK